LLDWFIWLSEIVVSWYVGLGLRSEEVLKVK
jgi:hypothetical protein